MPVHELAVCQALMEQVENIAQEEHADHVATIHLAIGPLSGVEPRLLEQAFFIARAGGSAADAELVIESMPVQVSCKQCGQLTEVLPSRLLCGACGDWRTSLISGDELELTSIELVRDKSGSEKAKDTENYGTWTSH
jgi:hydrogenase nickel incorporation protein HypA/HybF